MRFLRKYARELTIVLFLSILIGFLITPFFIITIKNYFIIGSLGLLLLFSWFIAIYFLYANKKVKRHGEVLIRVRFTEKLFNFFILPSLFYIVVVCTSFFVKSFYLNFSILISFAFILFIILIHIRSSYEKVHYVSSVTRVVYDAVLIMIFFLSMFVITSLGFLDLERAYFSVVIAAVLLLYKLIIDKQLCRNGIILIVVSALFLFLVSYTVMGFNLFVITAVTTLSFYLVVSIWTIRLAGYTKWGDYFNPIIYTIMALILIFSL
jgi:hypothetical protein